MIEIGRREFAEADQAAFAALSGDRNPVHMDEAVARRTIFGGRVVHGVHLVLWALDRWLRTQREAGSLEVLEAKFVHGLALHAGVVCRDIGENGSDFTIELRQGEMSIALVKGRFGTRIGTDISIPSSAPEMACQENALEELAEAAGGFDLFLDQERLHEMFPQVAARLPAGQVAAMLATTRLVGMVCPGLHSAFSGFQLRFGGPCGEPQLHWRVERAVPHLSIVRLAVSAPGMTGGLQTMFRPRPADPASLEKVRQLVTKGEFAGQRALIVGGSRGLGEVAAKIISAGGGDVCLTYFAGETDAQRLCAVLRSAGSEAMAVSCDVLKGQIPTPPWAPTHIYYFASPRITGEREPAFSAEKFAQYSRYYIEGFARILLHVITRKDGPVRVFYPSTVFLDEAAPMFAEYCMAKAAGEALCRQLGHRFRHVKFHAPRLPRMNTDQTVSLLPVATVEPLAVLLAELRALDRA